MPAKTAKSGSRVDTILDLIDTALAEYDASVAVVPSTDDDFPLAA